MKTKVLLLMFFLTVPALAFSVEMEKLAEAIDTDKAVESVDTEKLKDSVDGTDVDYKKAYDSGGHLCRLDDPAGRGCLGPFSHYVEIIAVSSIAVKNLSQAPRQERPMSLDPRGSSATRGPGQAPLEKGCSRRSAPPSA